nr:hypothetical protein [Corynebacterium pelargi]
MTAEIIRETGGSNELLRVFSVSASDVGKPFFGGDMVTAPIGLHVSNVEDDEFVAHVGNVGVPVVVDYLPSVESHTTEEISSEVFVLALVSRVFVTDIVEESENEHCALFFRREIKQFSG